MASVEHAEPPSLPADGTDQVFVSVKALKVGTMQLPDSWVFQDARDANVSFDVRFTIPDYAFLIEHPTKGKAMFDLGMQKVSQLGELDLLCADQSICARIAGRCRCYSIHVAVHELHEPQMRSGCTRHTADRWNFPTRHQNRDIQVPLHSCTP